MLGCYHAPLPTSAYFKCLSSPSPNTPLGSSRATPPSTRQVLFIGDSSVRQLFFATVRLVDGGKGAVPKDWESDAEKHTDRKLSFHNSVGEANAKSVELEFWW